MITKLIQFIKNQKHYLSSDRYITFLRSKGITIGENCIIRFPKTTIIDMTRPHLISIGNRVDMNINFKIYTHDWASHVFIGKYNQMINSSGSVTIGNNIYFGADCTILKGVSIGDNCIIGAGSVVTKSIPPNSVAVGNPYKVIYSLDEYFSKRLKEAPLEAKHNVITFYKKYGRYPNENELSEEYIYYNDNQSLIASDYKFNSFKEFLDWCKNDNK